MYCNDDEIALYSFKLINLNLVTIDADLSPININSHAMINHSVSTMNVIFLLTATCVSTGLLVDDNLVYRGILKKAPAKPEPVFHPSTSTSMRRPRGRVAHTPMVSRTHWGSVITSLPYQAGSMSLLLLSVSTYPYQTWLIATTNT